MKSSSKAAVAAGLLLAALSHAHAGSAAGLGGILPQTVAAIPIGAGGSYTPASWASAYLGALGMPRTQCNLNAIEAWEMAEGGAWNNSANANPLNTTEPEPGDWTINGVGVKAYPSWPEGLQANVTVINNGLYGGILSALRAGNNAQAVANAVAASPWGTSPFSANC